MISTFRSHAKINLFLHVTGRRKDGYHTLCSLMTRIDLCDKIDLDFSSDRICVTCGYPGVPEDESNLAVKAAALFFKASGINDCRVAITIDKKIPPGGGLGGGSSNAATVLNALNVYFDRPFSAEELEMLGFQLGADIPFFIKGKPAIATGIGEKLETVENLVPYYLVLCAPGIESSTAEVYKNIDFRLTENQKYNMNTGLNVPRRGQKLDAVEWLHNDLEDPACRLYPEIRQIKEEMSLVLKKQVSMTGSGSSLFALFTDVNAARQGCDRLKEHWSENKRKVFLSSFVLN